MEMSLRGMAGEGCGCGWGEWVCGDHCGLAVGKLVAGLLTKAQECPLL